MIHKLKRIDLIRENFDSISIEAECICEFIVSEMTKDIHCVSGRVNEYFNSKVIGITLYETANTYHNECNIGICRYKVFDLLSRCDITGIRVIYEDLTEIFINAPWEDYEDNDQMNMLQSVKYDKSNGKFYIVISAPLE